MDLGNAERAHWLIEAVRAEGIRMGPASACRNLMHTDVVKNKVQVHPALPPFGPGWPGEKVVYDPASCPNTDAIVASMASVGISPCFTPRDVDDIGTAIIKAWNARPAALFD